jgi:hypothetical protein
MFSTRGVRWLMWVDETPPMSAATAEMLSRCRYHCRSMGVSDNLNAAVARSRNSVACIGASPCCVVERSASSRSLGLKSWRWEIKAFQSVLCRLVEETWVVADEHRGEDPEGVPGELVSFDGAKRGGDDWD